MCLRPDIPSLHFCAYLVLKNVHNTKKNIFSAWWKNYLAQVWTNNTLTLFGFGKPLRQRSSTWGLAQFEPKTRDLNPRLPLFILHHIGVPWVNNKTCVFCKVHCSTLSESSCIMLVRKLFQDTIPIFSNEKRSFFRMATFDKTSTQNYNFGYFERYKSIFSEFWPFSKGTERSSAFSLNRQLSHICKFYLVYTNLVMVFWNDPFYFSHNTWKGILLNICETFMRKTEILVPFGKQ